jgi:hypothetical protein
MHFHQPRRYQGPLPVTRLFLVLCDCLSLISCTVGSQQPCWVLGPVGGLPTLLAISSTLSAIALLLSFCLKPVKFLAFSWIVACLDTDVIFAFLLAYTIMPKCALGWIFLACLGPLAHIIYTLVAIRDFCQTRSAAAWFCSMISKPSVPRVNPFSQKQE